MASDCLNDEQPLRLRGLDSQVKEGGAVTMCANYPSDLTDEQWQVIRAIAKALEARTSADR